MRYKKCCQNIHYSLIGHHRKVKTKRKKIGKSASTGNRTHDPRCLWRHTPISVCFLTLIFDQFELLKSRSRLDSSEISHIPCIDRDRSEGNPLMSAKDFWHLKLSTIGGQKRLVHNMAPFLVPLFRSPPVFQPLFRCSSPFLRDLDHPALLTVSWQWALCFVPLLAVCLRFDRKGL